ncbi:MAG: hypothetical protein ABI593_00025 [Betaproteobacteria bacterium]
MNVTFDLDRAAHELYDAQGRRFDAMTRTWTFVRSAEKSAACEKVDALAAVAWLQKESEHALRVPIGVIGPRDASSAQLVAALRVGELLADCGFIVICGGRHGVMQSVCEGVKRVGGMSIALLPDTDISHANSFVTVALATGIGEARNALLASASLCLIAIGDSFGTLSEVALGRQFGKPVIGLEGAAQVDGVVHAGSPQEAVTIVAKAVLGVTG